MGVGESETDLETITQVSFPKPLSYRQVRDFFKELPKLLATRERRYEVQIHTHRTERFGDLYNLLPIAPHASPIASERVTGAISSRMRNADFQVESDYVNNFIRYMSIQFNVTPGYKPGELSSDDAEIMRRTKAAVKKYFK